MGKEEILAMIAKMSKKDIQKLMNKKEVSKDTSKEVKRKGMAIKDNTYEGLFVEFHISELGQVNKMLKTLGAKNPVTPESTKYEASQIFREQAFGLPRVAPLKRPGKENPLADTSKIEVKKVNKKNGKKEKPAKVSEDKSKKETELQKQIDALVKANK